MEPSETESMLEKHERSREKTRVDWMERQKVHCLGRLCQHLEADQKSSIVQQLVPQLEYFAWIIESNKFVEDWNSFYRGAFYGLKGLGKCLLYEKRLMIHGK